MAKTHPMTSVWQVPYLSVGCPTMFSSASVALPVDTTHRRPRQDGQTANLTTTPIVKRLALSQHTHIYSSVRRSVSAVCSATRRAKSLHPQAHSAPGGRIWLRSGATAMLLLGGEERNSFFARRCWTQGKAPSVNKSTTEGRSLRDVRCWRRLLFPRALRSATRPTMNGIETVDTGMNSGLSRGTPARPGSDPVERLALESRIRSKWDALAA
ncbi:hypothetical protein IWZ03DRAFT_426835 [Phyllosticta citriasiana]|uniref:Uncharacterized protein n=1 Tax=Phyllosticta citriasiana TaxID=595635 RepID=A0ABR1KCM1_9PEZI